MKIKLYYILLLTFSLLLSCSKEDTKFDLDTQFYANVNTTITNTDVLGTWAIFNLEFNEENVAVPINYQECGRDYLLFSENGVYKEYVYQSSNCTYLTNTFSWILSDGIITLSNQLNQVEELAITKLTRNQFNFKTRFDVNEDGELDLLKAFLKPYTPKETDLISDTFTRDLSEEKQNTISYTWQPYKGSEEFVAYEVYRSSGENCSKTNALLVATITDATNTNFTDLSPLKNDYLCYFLKIKIKSKVLGESILQTLYTLNLEATPVNLNEPEVINNTINLQWTKSEMPYFSHYEISYSNFPPNITGYGEQNVSVVKITDKNTTRFIDKNPPYLENPYYRINVFDIFGNKTYNQYENHNVTWQVNFKRDEILDIKNIISYAINTGSPIIHLLANGDDAYNYPKIYNYNYLTHKIETTSTTTINTSTSLPITFSQSSNGKELFIEQAGDLKVYNAESLEFKYNLKTINNSIINDFIYTTSGFWVLIDSNYIYTYTRDKGQLTLIDKKTHFTKHQSSYYYNVLEIEKNQLLLGHKNEVNSILYSIDYQGFLNQIKTISLPIMQSEKINLHYNAADSYIINFSEKRIFSTTNFSELTSFNQPNFACGISVDGNYIFGSNNNPDWSVSDDGQQKKEAIIFNRKTQQIETIATKGYPHVIFENYKGKIISISSGMKRDRIKNTISDTKDLFIEIIK